MSTPTFQAPAVLADHRAARARRRVRAGGQVPSDFMALDYAADPLQPPAPLEGPGIPWFPKALVIAGSLLCLGLIARGIYSFFN